MINENKYSNFVRPSSPPSVPKPWNQPTLEGNEAMQLYLEEIKGAKKLEDKRKRRHLSKRQEIQVPSDSNEWSQKDLFVFAENNDVQTLCKILDCKPEMLNSIDDYGWSLLMIACQANAVDVVRELMKRGCDTSVRDKAGNSARSLVIRNKNLILADILLKYKIDHSESTTCDNLRTPVKHKSKHKMKPYSCAKCNQVFSDKEKHLSSTLHNISASKGKRIPTNYKIPESNKGFQIMVRVGWDKESGLGPEGQGHKYPIKTTQKQDRKGLGLKKTKVTESDKVENKHINKKILEMECKKDQNLEKNFRRQFY